MWAPALGEWTHLCELYRKTYPHCAGMLYRLWQWGPTQRWLNTYIVSQLNMKFVWSSIERIKMSSNACQLSRKWGALLGCMKVLVTLILFYSCVYICLLKYSKHFKYDFANSPCYQAFCTGNRLNGCLVHKQRFWKNSASSMRRT